ncbi:MAG: hypothetical protein ACLFWM_13620 [Actinomycetota bacterium]
MTDSETSAALRRAARRAAFHLLRAGLEGVRALEAFIDELAKVGRDDGPGEDQKGPERVRIDVE